MNDFEYHEQRQRVVEELRVLLELADRIGKDPQTVAIEFMAAFQEMLLKQETTAA